MYRRLSQFDFSYTRQQGTVYADSIPSLFTTSVMSMTAVRIIASLDAFSAAPSSSTGNSPSAEYNWHKLLRSFASRKTKRSSNGRHSTGTADEDGAGSSGSSINWNPLEVEWSVFQDWPEGLEREEKEMKVRARARARAWTRRFGFADAVLVGHSNTTSISNLCTSNTRPRFASSRRSWTTWKPTLREKLSSTLPGT